MAPHDESLSSDAISGPRHDESLSSDAISGPRRSGSRSNAR